MITVPLQMIAELGEFTLDYEAEPNDLIIVQLQIPPRSTDPGLVKEAGLAYRVSSSNPGSEWRPGRPDPHLGGEYWNYEKTWIGRNVGLSTITIDNLHPAYNGFPLFFGVWVLRGVEHSFDGLNVSFQSYQGGGGSGTVYVPSQPPIFDEVMITIGGGGHNNMMYPEDELEEYSHDWQILSEPNGRSRILAWTYSTENVRTTINMGAQWEYFEVNYMFVSANDVIDPPDPPDPTPGIVWDAPGEQYFITGLDRGVLYPKDGPPVPWNGLTALDEAGGGTKTVLYRDGQIFYADVEPGDFEGTLTCLFYPDEFGVCAGIPEATDGLYADNQKPQRFGLSYRNLVGSGLTGDMFGYQIHLVYQATAAIGTRAHKTNTNVAELMPFTFDLVAVPVKLQGMRPTAHYIIDTRFIDDSVIAELEGILYGTAELSGRLPEPQELFDLMHFGSAITFTDNGDGTWIARGSRTNLVDNGDGTWQINNVNGTDNGDGTYTLEDTL